MTLHTPTRRSKPYVIIHRHGLKLGQRSQVTAEEFHRHIKTGMLKEVAPKIATPIDGFLVFVDSETKELMFLRSTGHIRTNWQSIMRIAKYFHPSTAATVKARHDDGQRVVEDEPEWERVETQGDGCKIIHFVPEFYVTPLC